MRLSSRSTGPSRRWRRYNSFGWREIERGREGDESTDGTVSKFLARRTTVSTFLPPLPRYSDLSSTQCPFLSRRKTRKILLTGTKPSSWLVDQPRDARNYPLHGFGATVDLAMRSKFSAVSIVSIPLRFEISRGTVSFLFFLAFRRDKASYRIEGRCDEFVFLLFSLFFFYLSKRRNEKLGIIFHIIRNFLDRIVVDAILFTMIEDSILIILRLVQ